MVTSNFRPEVEIWLFRTCAVKNMYVRNSSVVMDFLWGRYHVSHDVFLVYI